MFKGKNNHRQRAGRICYSSLHAEMNVLLNILKSKDKYASFTGKICRKKKRYNGAIIYVARPLANGKYGNARPCKHCAEYLIMYGISRVKYTDVQIVDGVEIGVLCEIRL